jgi:hypothetical protein
LIDSGSVRAFSIDLRGPVSCTASP